MSETRDMYVEQLKTKLVEWNSQIDKLAEKKQAATADAAQKYAQSIDALKAKRAEVEHKLSEVRKAGDTAWKDLKGGVDLAVAAMNNAVKTAWARFQ